MMIHDSDLLVWATLYVVDVGVCLLGQIRTYRIPECVAFTYVCIS